jgi:SAM-dependent methyltransferase
VLIASNVISSDEAVATFPIVWEESPCPLCGREGAQPILEAADPDPTLGGLRFAVVRCGDCGLHYTNPRPDAASIERFYTPDYRPHRSPRLLRSLHRRWYPLARLVGRPCLERRRLPWHGQGRLLDFGCGGGRFLLRMQDQGWKVLGLDRSPGLVAQLREKLGVRALAGSLPHVELAPQSFDVITMWSTLAHVHQPLAALREAYRLLVPGGRLYVEVPNIASLAFSWFGGDWAALDLPRHLTHFCPTTLRAMLMASGFDVRQMRRASHPDWVRASARAIRQSILRRQLLRLRPVARLISWIGYATGRADAIMSIGERPE